MIKILNLKKFTQKEIIEQCTGVWKCVFQFDAESNDEINSIENQLGEWLSLNFSNGFVFLGVGTKLLAGGSVDNRLAWKKGWRRNDKFLPDNFQIRCDEKDAILFLLKFAN